VQDRYPNINNFASLRKQQNADSALQDHADRCGGDDNHSRSVRECKGRGGVRRRHGFPVCLHPVLSQVSGNLLDGFLTSIMNCSMNGSRRLQLPGKIEENDDLSSVYNCEKGDFTLCFSKVNKGEHFKNLEMITSLLAPPKNKSTVIPNIEVIGKL